MMDQPAHQSDASPADTYRGLWDNARQSPALDAFLARYDRLTPRQLGEVLLVDQYMRWRSGVGPPAEEYFQGYSQLADAPSLYLDLVYGEFRVRSQSDQTLGLGDLVARFPELGDQLRRQFEVSEWISRDETAQQETNVDESHDWTVTEASGGMVDCDSIAPLTFADFRLEATIGAGAMGTVHRAVQLSLNKPVAVKVLRMADRHQSELTSRFLGEARAVASLRHDNIVDVHGIGRTDNGELFLVMDLIEGHSLSERLADGSLTAEEAVVVVRQVARAVGHAHSRGVIHRDIKPSNVLMASDARVLLTDFGLARTTEPTDHTLSRFGQIIGTPGYMAPEQADPRRGDIGVATDVYGIGGLLYALLTGVPPVRGSSAIEVILQTVSSEQVLSPRSLRPEIPRSLESICLKCLQKNPEERFRSAREVEDALERYRRANHRHGETEPVVNTPPPLARHVINLRLYLGLLAGAVLLACAFMLAGNALWSSKEPDSNSDAVRLAAVEPARVDIEWTIDVYRQKRQDRQERLTDQPAPIYTGDSLRIATAWTDARFAYLYWIGSDASVSRLYPDEQERTQRVDQLVIPESLADGLPVSAPAGTEICVLLLRTEPLSDADAPLERLMTGRAPPAADALVLLIDGREVRPPLAGRADSESLDPLGHVSRPIGPVDSLIGVEPGVALRAWLEAALTDLGQISFVALKHSEPQ